MRLSKQFLFPLLFIFACGQLKSEELQIQDFQIPNDRVSEHFSLTPMVSITEKVQRRLIQDLGVNPGEAKAAPVSRLFVSDWFVVSMGKVNYVVDAEAKYWLKSDLDEVYLFSPRIERVSISNSGRESLMKLQSFIKASVDTFPVYSSTGGSVRQVVYVFVDLTCPHCRKFHLTTRARWQAKGVTFVYVPFLKHTDDALSERINRFGFCGVSQTQMHERIDKVYLTETRDLRSLNTEHDCSPYRSQILDFMLLNGERYGMAGSPMFLTESGSVIYGAAAFERSAQHWINQHEKWRK